MATALEAAAAPLAGERRADRRLRAGISRAAARRLAGVIILDAGVLAAHFDAHDALHARADGAAERLGVRVG